MDEIDIKIAVLETVREASRGTAKPLVASEYSLGDSGVRADLAILGEAFLGVEIKSGSDSLKRLPSQMRGYQRYFDQTLLVVDERHIPALDESILEGVDVWRLPIGGGIGLPRESSHAAYRGSLLELMTLGDRKRTIKRAQNGKPKLWVGPPELQSDFVRREFVAVFKARYGATSRAFWKAVSRRKIRRDDLSILSRFHVNRQMHEAAQHARKEIWRSWSESISMQSEQF